MISQWKSTLHRILIDIVKNLLNTISLNLLPYSNMSEMCLLLGNDCKLKQDINQLEILEILDIRLMNLYVRDYY